MSWVLGDGTVGWGLAISGEVPRWFIWGLLAPAIARVDRRVAADGR